MGFFMVLIPLFSGTGLAWALSRRQPERLTSQEFQLACRLRARARTASLLGLVLGAFAMTAVILTPGLGLGIGAALTPMAGIGALLVTLCVAELTTPVARTTQRSATLGTRQLRDYSRRAPALLAVTGPLVLVAALLVGWAMGDPDDAGRAGRALTTQCGPFGESRGPWPGAYYAVPMLLALVVVLAVAAATLVVVVRRSRSSAESAETDDAMRRAAVRRVLLVTAALGFIATVPVTALMGSAALGLGCSPAWYPAFGVACLAVTTACSMLGAGCLGSAMAGPRFVVTAEKSIA